MESSIGYRKVHEKLANAQTTTTTHLKAEGAYVRMLVDVETSYPESMVVFCLPPKWRALLGSARPTLACNREIRDRTGPRDYLIILPQFGFKPEDYRPCKEMAETLNIWWRKGWAGLAFWFAVLNSFLVKAVSRKDAAWPSQITRAGFRAMSIELSPDKQFSP